MDRKRAVDFRVFVREGGWRAFFQASISGARFRLAPSYTGPSVALGQGDPHLPGTGLDTKIPGLPEADRGCVSCGLTARGGARAI